MKSKLDIALQLAVDGFHVFPLEPGSKLPDITDWQNKATRDTDQIMKWFTCPVMGVPIDRNIGICTTRFGGNKALLVVDVDNKDGKDGTGQLLQWTLSNGTELKTDCVVKTPTGGYHYYFIIDKPVKNGVNVLGPGVDIRSRAGFVVAPGSETERGVYEWIKI